MHICAETGVKALPTWQGIQEALRFSYESVFIASFSWFRTTEHKYSQIADDYWSLAMKLFYNSSLAHILILRTIKEIIVCFLLALDTLLHFNFHIFTPAVLLPSYIQSSPIKPWSNHSYLVPRAATFGQFVPPIPWTVVTGYRSFCIKRKKDSKRFGFPLA